MSPRTPEAFDRDAIGDELRHGIAALGLEVADGHQASLIDYLALLHRWNGVLNLTAVRGWRDMVTLHLLDCLAVVAPIEARAPAAVRVLDVGSGGGLPGAVLAIVRPQLQVLCVDAVGKKSAFVQQVAGALRLPNLSACHARVENMHDMPVFDLIVSRAFASLLDFVSATQPLLAPGGAWMAMKGADPVDERKALPQAVDVFHVEPLTIPGLDARRCLVWMRRSAAAF